MHGILFRNRLIWILTTAMIALFSINNTNIYGSYFLLVISIIIFFVDYKKPVGFFSFLVGSYQKRIFIFSLYCLITALWAINRADPIERGVTVFSILICMSILIRHYRYRNNNIELLFKSIMWAGFIVAIYTIVFTGLGSITSTVSEGGRMDSTFDNVNTIGFFCSITITIAVYFFLFNKETSHLIFILPTLLVISGAASRKAFLFLFVGVASLFLFKHLKFKGVKTIYKLLFLFVIVYLAFNLLSSLPMFSGVMSRMEGLTNVFSGEGKVDSSTLERQEYALVGLSIFLEHPLVGIGIANAHIINLQTTGNDTYLHNNFVELLAGGGIVGFLIYYSISFYVLYRILKEKLFVEPMGKLILILQIILIAGDFGMVSYYSKFTYLYLMTFYLFLEKYQIKNNNKNEKGKISNTKNQRIISY